MPSPSAPHPSPHSKHCWFPTQQPSPQLHPTSHLPFLKSLTLVWGFTPQVVLRKDDSRLAWEVSYNCSQAIMVVLPVTGLDMDMCFLGKEGWEGTGQNRERGVSRKFFLVFKREHEAETCLLLPLDVEWRCDAWSYGSHLVTLRRRWIVEKQTQSCKSDLESESACWALSSPRAMKGNNEILNCCSLKHYSLEWFIQFPLFPHLSAIKTSTVFHRYLVN